MCAHMTPAQAAERAEVSRWTIMRAINSQRLRATRDNRNRWRIEQGDLDKWRSNSAHSVRAQPDAQPDAPHPSEDRDALIRFGVEVGMLRERAEAAERDRDAWHDEAEAWKRQAEELTGVLATRRRRWWPWGRS